MTIWWQGSIWHVAITAESEGVRVVCETEGLQLPAQVTCPVAAGEVTFAMDLGVDGQPGAGPPDVKVAAPLTP